MAAVTDLQTENVSCEWNVRHLLGYFEDGISTHKGFLRLHRNNARESGDDHDAKYRTDFVFQLDGKIYGYLDLESKPGWKTGDFASRYRQINIARYPMSHWQNGKFTDRETNKMVSFREYPHTSVWIGSRNDGRAVVVVLAAVLILYGSEVLQHTKYSTIPLPVLSLASDAANTVDTPEAVRDEILSLFGLVQV